MSNIIINDSKEFDVIINKLENTLPVIRDIFSSLDEKIECINGTEIWYGKTQETFCNKYLEFSENYPVINEAFENYVKFLKIVLNNYKKAENKINSNIENNLNNLDVN